MAEVYESRIITEERPTKLLLEVANSLYQIHNTLICTSMCAHENAFLFFSFLSFFGSCAKIPFPLLQFLFTFLSSMLSMYMFSFCSLVLLSFQIGGSIRLYTEKLKSQPIISVLEENPLPIQYISFASFENTEVQFFYNCSHIDTSLKSVMG